MGEWEWQEGGACGKVGEGGYSRTEPSWIYGDIIYDGLISSYME